MSGYTLDQDSRREYRRRCLSDSEDDRFRKDSDLRRQGSRPAHRHLGTAREASRSRPDYGKRNRSRSPQKGRPETRRRYSSDRESPDRHPRSHRDNSRHSRRDHSLSRSPPPKRRRSGSRDKYRRTSHLCDHRRYSPPRRRTVSPPTALPITKSSRAPLPSQKDAFTKDPSSGAVIKPRGEAEAEKQKPNYAPTGKLAAETNTVANTSIILKYNEPPEARLPPPSSQWRLYIFKGSDLLGTLPLHERSCWLFGRERTVVDFPTEHPSCSKQHAVLQFRYTEKKNEWGERKGKVKPYLIDLESANGTKVNGETVPERQFFELRSSDVFTFGESTREYVLILPPKEERNS